MFPIIAKTEKEKELVALAQKVSDSYHDFVLGALHFSRVPDEKDESIVDAMISFMKENPEATTSEVSLYQSDLNDEYNERRRVMGLPLLWGHS